VAEFCGISRPHLFGRPRRVRDEGLEALLEREKLGRKEGTRHGVKPEAIAQLGERLAAQKFASAEAARRWRKAEHGVERPDVTVWSWLKNWKGVLGVPRPSHSRKNPGVAQEFKGSVAEKFEALGIKAGSRVKVWLMDEARFGLHPEMRRV
jgi:hypothetical protein